MPDDSKRSMTDAERAVRKARVVVVSFTSEEMADEYEAAAEWRALERLAISMCNTQAGDDMGMTIEARDAAHRRYEEASE